MGRRRGGKEGEEEGGKGEGGKEEGKGRGKEEKDIMCCNFGRQAHTLGYMCRMTADYSYLIVQDPSSFGWSERSVEGVVSWSRGSRQLFSHCQKGLSHRH